MEHAAANTPQILGRAFIVATLLVLAPTLFAVAAWYVAPGTRDPDMIVRVTLSRLRIDDTGWASR